MAHHNFPMNTHELPVILGLEHTLISIQDENFNPSILENPATAYAYFQKRIPKTANEASRDDPNNKSSKIVKKKHPTDVGPLEKFLPIDSDHESSSIIVFMQQRKENPSDIGLPKEDNKPVLVNHGVCVGYQRKGDEFTALILSGQYVGGKPIGKWQENLLHTPVKQTLSYNYNENGRLDGEYTFTQKSLKNPEVNTAVAKATYKNGSLISSTAILSISSDRMIINEWYKPGAPLPYTVKEVQYQGITNIQTGFGTEKHGLSVTLNHEGEPTKIAFYKNGVTDAKDSTCADIKSEWEYNRGLVPAAEFFVDKAKEKAGIAIPCVA